MHLLAVCLIFGLIAQTWSSARCHDNDLVTLLQTGSHLQPGQQRAAVQQVAYHTGRYHAEDARAGIPATLQQEVLSTQLNNETDSSKYDHTDLQESPVALHVFHQDKRELQPGAMGPPGAMGLGGPVGPQGLGSDCAK